MLKSDMADAKKGDSFMRHNITKKVISAMLSGVLMLSLAGCGKAAKLPETVVNTSLVVEKNGKVVSYDNKWNNSCSGTITLSNKKSRKWDQ